MKRALLCILSAILLFPLLFLPSPVLSHMPYPWPLVSTLPATSITYSSAVLNGELTQLTGWVPCALVSFEYGEKSGQYTFESTQTVNCDNGTFRATIGNLKPCTTYYVVAKAARVTTANVTNIDTGLHGAGIGLDIGGSIKKLFSAACTVYGNEIIFKTLGCDLIRPAGQGTSGSSSSVQSPTGPVPMSNIIVQSASIAANRVGPGDRLDVTAFLTNNGNSSGDARVALYVSGQEVDCKGITLTEGQTSSVHFQVSRNVPGTYDVYVNSVSAGSFTVDQFANNDFLIYGIIGLFMLGIASTLHLIMRRRTN
ncbi:MAG: hypothetical protein JXA01_03125 [Dehalococcoidia bacterium]|nr:hypothetical protein [Dehalococcoidia bacterium]